MTYLRVAYRTDDGELVLLVSTDPLRYKIIQEKDFDKYRKVSPKKV